MEQMQMNMPDIYDAALYLRLSKDDMEEGDAKSESNSIANQRELLRSFVKSQPDIQIFDIYVDDGYSGGNFDRPEFKRMTTDIEAGKVNCVIVKDLSRFGREYIEAGRWIEKTYPALNVRFISVTDQFDSKTADFSEKSFVVPIKNFVNESYCRDISGKVRSHQKIKREKGEFIGAFAPYGYCKDPENKNCLVIDSYAADIVRKIFSWKIDGFSLGAIAEKLNVRHVQSPKEYKKARAFSNELSKKDAQKEMDSFRKIAEKTKQQQWENQVSEKIDENGNKMTKGQQAMEIAQNENITYQEAINKLKVDEYRKKRHFSDSVSDQKVEEQMKKDEEEELNKEEKEYKKRLRREWAAAVCCVAACLAVIAGVSLSMPDIVSRIEMGTSSGFETAATMLGGSTTLGYIVVGLLAFVLGVCVTVLCFRIRRLNEEEQTGEPKGENADGSRQ